MRSLLASLLSMTLILGVTPDLHAQARRKAPTKGSKAPARTPAKGGKGPAKAPAKAPAKGGKAPTKPQAEKADGSNKEEEKQEDQSSESPEFKALQEAERELFPQRAPKVSSPILDASSLLRMPGPEVIASGAPLAPALQPEAKPEPTSQLDWIQSLKMPDLQARMDERVLKYLQFFHDDPRGRGMAALGWRRVNRYSETIRTAFRTEKVPEALIWVSMAESGFNPTARSHVGAVGLWQFMPDSAKIYGLRVDRWLDERKDPARASAAAARYLADLHRRFGSWELALAAYNMGFGGLSAAIRKYNTNDFWELCRYEAGIPWETTLYVPKILAMTIVAENPKIFGLDGLQQEPKVASEPLRAAASTSLAAIARAANMDEAELQTLNPQISAKRTPPAPLVEYEIQVSIGKAADIMLRLESEAQKDPKTQLLTIRFGQTIASLARDLGVSRASLANLNGLAYDENPLPGEAILIPASAKLTPSGERPVVVVPQSSPAIPGRQRVFYRVINGDTLEAIAAAFRVQTDDVRSWNLLDPSARLLEGTTLQLFLPPHQDLSGVVVFRESEVRTLIVGSENFFDWFESQKGRRRVIVTVGPRETWQTLARKYGISLGLLERINRRSHTVPLKPGETVIVYTRKPGEPSQDKEKTDEAS